MIKRYFKNQKLTRNRKAAIKKIQYQKLYPITMYLSRYMNLKLFDLINFVQNRLKSVIIIDF